MKKSEIALLTGLVILDQVSKAWIAGSMRLHESIEVIRDFFYITYVQNTGAAWSILEGQLWFFIVITVVALVVMGYFFRTAKPHQVVLRIGLVCIIAGTLGNFIDRLWLQGVRDFLDFYIFGYDFPVFNVADMALCVGVGLLALDVIAGKEDRHD